MKHLNLAPMKYQIFTNKVLSQQCFSMTFYCNDVVKRVGKYYSLHSTVPRCASHWIIKLRYLSRDFFRKRHKLYGYAIQNVNTHIPKSENQLDWWKGIRCWRTCQNSNSTDVAEELKPVYNTNCSLKNNLKTRIQTSVPKFFAIQKRKFLTGKRHTTGTQKLKRYTREYLPI